MPGTCLRLRQRYSIQAGICVIAINVVSAIAISVLRPGTFRGGDIYRTAVIVAAVSRLFLCLVVRQMTSMKYQDKQARGTK